MRFKLFQNTFFIGHIQHYIEHGKHGIGIEHGKHGIGIEHRVKKDLPCDVEYKLSFDFWCW
jgi:hypothetical protein